MSNTTDTKVLLSRLIEYKKSLERHLNQLTSEYIKLESRWRVFNAVSEGDYVEQFRSGWIKTETRFQLYIDQAQKVKEFLTEKIDNLSELNRQGSEFSATKSGNSGGYDSSLQNATDAVECIHEKIEGNSSKLGKNLGSVTENKIPGTEESYPDGSYEAHHVIPGESANKSPLVRAAIEKAGFNIDSAVNGIYLPRTDSQRDFVRGSTGIYLPKHSGYHKKYSAMIDNILKTHWDDMNDPDHLSSYFSRGDLDENQKLIYTLNSAIETIKYLMVSGRLDREDMYKVKKKKKRDGV